MWLTELSRGGGLLSDSILNVVVQTILEAPCSSLRQHRDVTLPYLSDASLFDSKESFFYLDELFQLLV